MANAEPEQQGGFLTVSQLTEPRCDRSPSKALAYVGLHPTIEDWHLASVAFEGATLYVPVHEGQFEAVS